MMEKKEFDRLRAAGYKRIPLVRSLLADLDTPVSTYMKLATSSYSYLLESVQGGERWSRYSFIGLPARRIIRVHNYAVTVQDRDGHKEHHHVEDPLDYISSLYQEISVPDLPYLPQILWWLSRLLLL